MTQRDFGRFAGAAVLVTVELTASAGRVRPGWPRKGLGWRWPTLDRDAARQVAKGLTDEARRHLAVWLDVTDVSSVEQAVADAAFGLGGIDVVVNVAGGDTDHGRFEETKDEVWVRMLELNLLGVVCCCRAAIAHLRRSTNSPAIVNVSSTNLAASLAPDGIRVNAVAPATIRTRSWDRHEGGADRLRHLYPLGRVGEPEDVAAAVAFLASGDAAWITGHTSQSTAGS